MNISNSNQFYLDYLKELLFRVGLKWIKTQFARYLRDFMVNNGNMKDIVFDRVVVGGGLFGAFAGLTLARQGFSVCLIEQGHQLLNRASYVNQARLHTGLHYPRSLVTARETMLNYQKFRLLYPEPDMFFVSLSTILKAV